MNRMFCMTGGLKCYTKGAVMAGTAITVHCSEGDNTLLHRAMDLAQPGDVIVVNDGGCISRSLCGEMMFNYAKSKGIAGFVLDGSIRDADSLDALGFPVYAKSITPQGPWKKGSGEINVPIACCGQVVFPGDIIVGDPDGVVVVHPACAEEVLDKAREKFAQETAQLKKYSEGHPAPAGHIKTYADIVQQNGMVTFDKIWQK